MLRARPRFGAGASFMRRMLGQRPDAGNFDRGDDIAVNAKRLVYFEAFVDPIANASSHQCLVSLWVRQQGKLQPQMNPGSSPGQAADERG